MSPRAGCTRSSVCLLRTGPARGPCGRISPGCPGAFGSTCLFFLYVFVVVVVDVIPSSFSLPPEAWPGLDRLAAKPVTLLPPCHYMEHFTPALWKRVYAASPSLRDYAEEERRVKLARRGRAGTAGSASGDFLQSKSEGPVTPCRAGVVRSVGLVSLKKKKKTCSDITAGYLIKLLVGVFCDSAVCQSAFTEKNEKCHRRTDCKNGKNLHLAAVLELLTFSGRWRLPSCHSDVKMFHIPQPPISSMLV